MTNFAQAGLTETHGISQQGQETMINLLTTSDDILKAVRSAMRRYQRFRWSVAWASSGFPLFDDLLKKRNRVSQLVVGTHFYQTHPDFLKAFLDDPKVHVALQPSGVFHPKIYLFENSPDDWGEKGTWEKRVPDTLFPRVS